MFQEACHERFINHGKVHNKIKNCVRICNLSYCQLSTHPRKRLMVHNNRLKPPGKPWMKQNLMGTLQNSKLAEDYFTPRLAEEEDGEPVPQLGESS